MIINAKNPRWVDTEHTALMLDVREAASDEWFSFVARASDCEAHGVRLYYETVYEKKYGAIADSDEERMLRGEMPLPQGCVIREGIIVNLVAQEAEAVMRLNGLLAAISTEADKARAEIDEAYAAERKAKLAALLAVKTQKGWPLNVEWPE
jgi:hypothetical protein